MHPEESTQSSGGSSGFFKKKGWNLLRSTAVMFTRGPVEPIFVNYRKERIDCPIDSSYVPAGDVRLPGKKVIIQIGGWFLRTNQFGALSLCKRIQNLKSSKISQDLSERQASSCHKSVRQSSDDCVFTVDECIKVDWAFQPQNRIISVTNHSKFSINVNGHVVYICARGSPSRGLYIDLDSTSKGAIWLVRGLSHNRYVLESVLYRGYCLAVEGGTLSLKKISSRDRLHLMKGKFDNFRSVCLLSSPFRDFTECCCVVVD